MIFNTAGPRVMHVGVLADRYNMTIQGGEDVHEDAINTAEEFLAQYGVKGMRWGQRRARASSADGKQSARFTAKGGGRVTASSKDKVSSDFKKVATHRGKPSHTLSNKQLKAINERMNLEQQYARANPSTLKRGDAKIKELLAIAGTGVAVYNLFNSAAGKAAISAGKKVLETNGNSPVHMTLA